jgi:hypothetical protein
LGLLQLSWFVITFLVISLFVVGLGGYYEQLIAALDVRALESLGVSPQGYAGYLILLDIVVLLAHVVIAAVIFFRRPFDWMALLVATALVVNGAIIPLSHGGDPAGLNQTIWNYLHSLVTFVGMVTSIVLLTLFPDGRFVPRWTRLFALVWAVIIFLALFLPNSALSLTTWKPLPRLLLLLTFTGIGSYAQIYRYSRVSTPLERQQTKWALLGLIAAAMSPLAYFYFTTQPSGVAAASVPNILFQRMGASFFALAMAVRLFSFTLRAIYFLLFPLSFAVAILRYRLWDIDILIRRTLIYSVLTGLLIAIYFGSVLVMQAGFLAFTGQGRSEVVTVFSTLAIAAVFVPLRNRVQNEIDKRFYHRKYDAAQTLASFSETLREEVDLDQLCKRVLIVVEETMQPKYVSLWVKGKTIVDSLPERGGDG